MTTKILKVEVPDIIKPEVIDIAYTTLAGNFESYRVYDSEFTEIDLTPAEIQAVVTLITLNESDNIYANPLLATAKDKIEKLLK